MTPAEKFALVRELWVRQLGQYMTFEQATDCVAHAELNGLFDIHKAEFARQEREHLKRDAKGKLVFPL